MGFCRYSSLVPTKRISSITISVYFSLGDFAYLKFRVEFAVFALTISTLFAIAAFLTPQILSPLNRLWFCLGLLLGKIVSPIVLALIFFVLITPVSLVTRLFGRDELKMKNFFTTMAEHIRENDYNDAT